MQGCFFFWATLIIDACFYNHKGVVEALLKRKDIDINNQGGPEKKTALHWAIKKGHLDIVRMLIKNKGKDININLQDNQGYTPLNTACANGHKGVVEALLKRGGINVNLQNNQGYTPLIKACIYGYKDVVKALLEWDDWEDIDVNLQDNQGYTPLINACFYNHKGVVEALLKRKDIDINNQGGPEKKTALHWAIEKGHLDIVRILIKNKDIDRTLKDKDGNTILDLAKKSQKMLEIIEPPPPKRRSDQFVLKYHHPIFRQHESHERKKKPVHEPNEVPSQNQSSAK